MADVFISYSHRDKQVIERLVNGLGRKNLSVSWDANLHVGPWQDDIEKELDKAKCIVVAWSSSSVVSNEVKAEAYRALKQDKLISVKIDNAELPYRYDIIEYLDFRTWNGRTNSGNFPKLLTEIHRKIEAKIAAQAQEADQRQIKQDSLNEAERRLKKIRAEIKAEKRRLESARCSGGALDVRPLIQSEVRYELTLNAYNFERAKSKIKERYRNAPSEYLKMALVALEYEANRFLTK